MAFLKPTKLKTDNKERLNYVDAYIYDSKLSEFFLIEINQEIIKRKKLLQNNYKDGEFIIDGELLKS